MVPSPAALDAYPRPNVAVDLALFTLLPSAEGNHHDRLGVVVLRGSDGTPTLPGRMVRERETIRETVKELVQEKLSHRPTARWTLRMLDVFDDPDRDPRGWVWSVGYSVAISRHEADLLTPQAELLAIRGSAARGTRSTSEKLSYDHDDIVSMAVRRMRRRYEKAPDPDGLLKAPYTLSQLRHAHEAVLGAPLKRDTFNRRMREFLEPAMSRSGEEMFTSETVGRPAQLFTPRRVAVREVSEPFPLPRSGSVT